jgi:hypothetical protein
MGKSTINGPFSIATYVNLPDGKIDLAHCCFSHSQFLQTFKKSIVADGEFCSSMLRSEAPLMFGD